MASKAQQRRLKNGAHRNGKPASSVSVSTPRWDQGATGPANRVGLVTEGRGDIDPTTGSKVNPNDVHGARRVDMLEVYHGRGWISDRGYSAGEVLRDAWTATQRSKGMDYSAVRVDSSPKPDANIDMQIERVSRYHAVASRIAKGDERILDAVVGEGRALSHLKEYRHLNHDKGKAHLREALDRLADAMDK
jgi:hypothetical protein